MLLIFWLICSFFVSEIWLLFSHLFSLCLMFFIGKNAFLLKNCSYSSKPCHFAPTVEQVKNAFLTLRTPEEAPVKDALSEATISAVKSIAKCCIKLGTVRRLIYTASVVASSPLKDDGSGYKDFIDETCWTPLHLFSDITGLHKLYTDSKTVAERELLSYGKDENGGGLEVVSLACGQVGGETLLSYTPLSVAVLISQVKDNEATYRSLKFLEDLVGKIPVVHIDDVCEAHVFWAEIPSINGRFLVASSYLSSADIANYYFQTYPEFNLKEKYLEGPKRAIKWASTKLTDKGFVYKYDLKMILDDCIRCARRMGDL